MKDEELELDYNDVGKFATNDGRCKKNYDPDEYVEKMLW